MSFSTANGTHGARQPSVGLIMRLFNKWAMGRARRSGSLFGGTALVLTTVGRKSGTQRSTPVICFPGQDGSWLIVASAAGAVKNPAWYYNIAAHPDQVRIETNGRSMSVIAEQLHGAERDAAWQQIICADRRFARYQARTDRELPVIRLSPRSAE